MIESALKSKKFALFLIGLPCSGKSTWIQRELAPYLVDLGVYYEVLSSDEIIEYYAKLKGVKFNEGYDDLFHNAVNVVNARIYFDSYAGFNMVIDQRNLTKTNRQFKIKQMKDSTEYHKIALIFNEKYDTIAERNKNRSDKSINPEIMQAMSNSYEAVLRTEGFEEILTPEQFRLKYMPVIRKDSYEQEGQGTKEATEDAPNSGNDS